MKLCTLLGTQSIPVPMWSLRIGPQVVLFLDLCTISSSLCWSEFSRDSDSSCTSFRAALFFGESACELQLCGSPGFLTLLPQLKALPVSHGELSLLSFGLETPQAVSWGSQRNHFLCFPSLGHCPMLLMINIWKSSFRIFCSFFSCFMSGRRRAILVTISLSWLEITM